MGHESRRVRGRPRGRLEAEGNMRAFTFITRITVVALGLMSLAGMSTAQAQEAQALVNARCGSCHAAKADGSRFRISEARKTPEAWNMTLVRMMVVHGVKLTSSDRRKLVKYLADTQGLAPSETKGYRYILEKTPGVTDKGPTEQLSQVCGRCHSFARVALQRRDKADWLRLANFHLGQYPTAEYQALGRDRDWWGIVQTKVVDALAKRQPFTTAAWTAWKSHKSPNLAGTWRVVGHQPGGGDYAGTLTIASKGNDLYSVTTRLNYVGGAKIERKGNAIVYTGYEWRAGTRGKDGRARQVMAVSADGKTMRGRWFYRDNDVIGGTMMAVRMEGAGTQLLAVSPGYVKRGGSMKVTLSGIKLASAVNLGEGVSARVLEKRANSIVVQVTASAKAPLGARTVKVGGASLANGLVVYDKVAAVKIVPDQTIARVGGNRGPIPRVPAQFEAVGYMAGPDGKAGTKDDMRIGVMPATWKVENFDDTAKAMKDAIFAGRITQSGLFNPAGAGPNPKRNMSTNNAGNLSVIGTVGEGAGAVSGKAHLFVTVQRFVDPPIR
jgi:quinohemoprotein amine dehydrogenase